MVLTLCRQAYSHLPPKKQLSFRLPFLQHPKWVHAQLVSARSPESTTAPALGSAASPRLDYAPFLALAFADVLDLDTSRRLLVVVLLCLHLQAHEALTLIFAYSYFAKLFWRCALARSHPPTKKHDREEASPALLVGLDGIAGAKPLSVSS